jgi:hypothetical protein
MADSKAPEKLYFDSIKEMREGFLAEYTPPWAGASFAMLELVFLKVTDPESIAVDMEAEATRWLSRYPTPVMVMAFDGTEGVICIEPHRQQDYLTAWISQTGTPELSWKSGDLDEYLKANPARNDLREIYRDVPFKTELDVKNNADKYIKERRQQNITLKIIFVLWLAIIPATVAIFEYFGPRWLETLVLSYTLWKAYRAGRKLLGHYKPSKREQEKAEEEQKKRHYYYHCERNPAGFLRLKSENFNADARERVRVEAERVASTVPNASANSKRNSSGSGNAVLN